MDFTIREYDATRDHGPLRDMAAALQDALRVYDPDLRPGDDMAADYVRRIPERCAEADGRVFVAVADGSPVGYVYVLARVVATEPEDMPRPYAYVHSLYVVEGMRGAGIGRALMARAEAHALEAGADTIHLEVSDGNEGAIGLYEDMGYEARYRWLAKGLDD